MKQILEQNANTIEYVLHQHGIDARVDGGGVAPRLFTFNLSLPPQVKRSRIAALTDKLAAELGVSAVRLSVRDGQPVLEVPRPDPATVRLLPLYQRLDEGEFGEAGEIPANTALLGLDTEGSPLLLRLDGEGVGNVLLVGQGNGGKSHLLRSMLGSMALANGPEELQILMVDAHSRSNALRQLEGLPHLLRPLITDSLDAVHHLRWLARHIEYREENDVATPTIVIAIDDAQPLLSASGPKFREALTTLCQRGPDVGIHVVLANRRPDDGIMGDSLHSNFNARVVARVNTAEEARQVVGSNGSGAEKLLSMGDMLVVINGDIVRMQAASISDAECRQLVGLMQKAIQEQQQEQQRAKQPKRKQLTARDLSTRSRATAAPEPEEDEEVEFNKVTRIRQPQRKAMLRLPSPNLSQRERSLSDQGRTMKNIFAATAAVCAIIFTTIVALKISSDTLAVLAGIIVGGFATIPLLLVAVMLLHRQQSVSHSFERELPPLSLRRLPPPTHINVSPLVVSRPLEQPEQVVDAEFYEFDDLTPNAPRQTVVNSQPRTGFRVIGN